MAIALSTTLLSGTSSKTPPGIDSDSLFGTVAVWADDQNQGTVTMAFSGSSPAYAPTVLNAAWSSFDTPAVAIATDWNVVFVAFVDADGFVQLASSGDGWTNTRTLGEIGVTAGPALAYADNLLYIAWQTSNSLLAFATCDQTGRITRFQTDNVVTSRPTISVADPTRIYVLCGGTPDEPQPIRICLSVDGGETFSSVPTQATTCFGPPSLVGLDQFYLAWADGQTSQLRLAQTPDLAAYTAMDYDVGCHGGGPALIPVVTIPDVNDPKSWVFSLSTGWSVGSTDPTLHQVAVGSFSPLPIGSARVEKLRQNIARRTAPRAPDRCPDPLTIYDPATDTCVPKGGCWGSCVLKAYGGGPLFNPISYALCVAFCENQEA